MQNVNLRDVRGCSVCEMEEFEILRVTRRLHSELITLESQRADFSFYLVEYQVIEPWRAGDPKRAG